MLEPFHLLRNRSQRCRIRFKPVQGTGGNGTGFEALGNRPQLGADTAGAVGSLQDHALCDTARVAHGGSLSSRRSIHHAAKSLTNMSRDLRAIQLDASHQLLVWQRPHAVFQVEAGEVQTSSDRHDLSSDRFA